MRVIKITQGYEVKIDDEDFDLISGRSWKVLRSRKRVYASYSYGKDSNKSMLMHRLIMNAEKGQYVDHINGDTLDNRKENLRLCTNSQNLGNRGKQSNNNSGYKGVHFHDGSYVAKIRKDNIVYTLGYSKDKIEAAKIYDMGSLHFYGEFSYLNFPDLKDIYLQSNEDKDYSNLKNYLNLGNYKNQKN